MPQDAFLVSHSYLLLDFLKVRFEIASCLEPCWSFYFDFECFPSCRKSLVAPGIAETFPTWRLDIIIHSIIHSFTITAWALENKFHDPFPPMLRG